MSNDINSSNLDEQRRRKAENFRLNIHGNDIQSDSSNQPPAEEITSYSGQDVKEQIAKESKRSLKKKKKAEKRELKRRNRRNRRLFRWMWIASVLIVGSAMGVFVVTGLNDLLAIDRTDSAVVNVKIPKNPSLETVTNALYKSGVIKEPGYFKMYATLTKSGDDFSQGTYELRKNMDYQAIITNLEGNSNRTDSVEVTIIEGQSVVEIADTLEKKGALGDKDKFLELCNSDKFDSDFDFIKDQTNKTKRYYRLEGYLYPDKYEFYVNDDPTNIIYKFLNNYETRLHSKQAYNGYDKLYTIKKMMEQTGTKHSLDEIMTIASIVQAEAANVEDMYYVSSILHNRLDAGQSMGVEHLGLDSTKYYPYRSADKVPASAGKNYKSRYDTYTLEGLPYGPICNPGMDAIKAALCPAESSYYYFCHDKKGNPYYASTIYEHEANLERIS